MTGRSFTAHLAPGADIARTICGAAWEPWQMGGPDTPGAPASPKEVAVCPECVRLSSGAS